MDIYEQCKIVVIKNKNKLRLDVVLEQLPKKDRESLRKALLDESVPSRTIEKVLIENQINCSNWSINRWRRVNNVNVYNSPILGKSK